MRDLKKSIAEIEFALEMARGRLTFAQAAIKEAEESVAAFSEGLERLKLKRLQRRYASAIRG
jgi:hypothetical protein